MCLADFLGWPRTQSLMYLCAVEFSLSQVAEVTVFLLEMLDALSDFIL